MERITKIPKKMNPATNPTDALTLAKQLGVVHNWAQNGISWDVIFTDNSRMQAVTVDVPDLVFNKIVEMKKAEIEEAKAIPQVEEDEVKESELTSPENPFWVTTLMDEYDLESSGKIGFLTDEEILDTHGIGEATLVEIRELYPEVPSKE